MNMISVGRKLGVGSFSCTNNHEISFVETKSVGFILVTWIPSNSQQAMSKLNKLKNYKIPWQKVAIKRFHPVTLMCSFLHTKRLKLRALKHSTCDPFFSHKTTSSGYLIVITLKSIMKAARIVFSINNSCHMNIVAIERNWIKFYLPKHDKNSRLGVVLNVRIKSDGMWLSLHFMLVTRPPTFCEHTNIVVYCDTITKQRNKHP